jgi:hypothetical protein
MFFCWCDELQNTDSDGADAAGGTAGGTHGRASAASSTGWGKFAKASLPAEALEAARAGACIIVIGSKGRKMLHFEWDDSTKEDFETDAFEDQYEKLNSWLSKVAEGAVSLQTLPDGVEELVPTE